MLLAYNDVIGAATTLRILGILGCALYIGVWIQAIRWLIRAQYDFLRAQREHMDLDFALPFERGVFTKPRDAYYFVKVALTPASTDTLRTLRKRIYKRTIIVTPLHVTVFPVFLGMLMLIGDLLGLQY